MDTGQINKCLSKVPGFLGTYACNQLPSVRRIRSETQSIIVNTARLKQSDLRMSRNFVAKGEHWIAIVLLEDGTSVYFDSFGNPPERKEVTDFLSQVSRNGCLYNTQMVQSPFSSTCGVFCIDFLISIMCGESLADYLANFRTNLLENDETTVSRVAAFMKILSVKLPLNMDVLLA